LNFWKLPSAYMVANAAAVGGITSAMKLKWPHEFYDRTPLKMGGLPCH
jgi:hypothetical protein